jgi:putative transcriptional regulator
MSLRKLCFFPMLATIVVGFIAIGSLNVPVEGFHIPTHNSGPLDTVLAPIGPKTENLPTVFLRVQSKDPKDLRVGSLLVASRSLADPNFAETVILLVHYDAGGVVGLILNRRTDMPLSQVLEGLEAAKGLSDPVYLGGPLETPVLFALLQSAAKLDGAEHIFGSVYLISKKALFEQIISTRPDSSVFHVYLGYAGWSPGQLRTEVQLGAWFIFQADAKTVFDADPDSLWPQMIRKTELELARSEPLDADMPTSSTQLWSQP